MKSIAAALLATLALTASPLVAPITATADPVDTTAVVLKVVDGDTIDIQDDNRGRLRIRVLGIDTPETKKPGYTIGCWGPQATQFASDTLLGQRVAFIADPTQDRTDHYGRTLAYLVKGDGWNYSVEAARAGTAHAYTYDNNPVEKYAEIAAAEQEAKAAGRGLWGPPCYGDTVSTAADLAGVYYDTCAAVRAAGAAPLLAGQQGYRSGLDRDGDGVACEP
ncbi:hypothetical protein NGTWS0302_24230 [Mycolicibacterium cyprinidarum]|uniref:TNase-like domain-containing protein n=1 Tax=Mycolicibacterium cyprinidarum TaxID=2860311 RepID=A0ABQ4VBX5_9MYCO|nr:hypothetical protein NGTWS0302_24230 [Mycolicibacterium sp. NGTWS0302]GJF13442.1 hypothetical protein NGTWS1803_24840 [Mycolicibacterium sp. NGTWS1803]GJF17146.1 hypothetical protein NGTWS1702_23120 [Mycolicibacterium sp. NGTWSNA01]